MLQNKKTLVLGATPKPERYAYLATEMLEDYKHCVLPFGVRKGAIGEVAILNEWPRDNDIDTATLYINPNRQKDFYDRILTSKPKRIIFNPGTENPELQRLADANDIVTQKALL